MSARAHYNRQLFSNHFLENRLRGDPLWDEIAAPASAVRARLRERFDAQADALAGANEAQTEERWIKPVLRALGWGFVVQPVSRRQGTTQFPDYALFDSEERADAAASERERRRVLKRGIGVLEAKRWARDLDAAGAAGDLAPNRVPSAQIINYLFRAEQPWGTLTNGAEWRLYYRDADFADTVYLAVDLPALLGDEPLPIGEAGETIAAAEAFRYFYLFFRPESWRVAAEQMRWLDRARHASARYARTVEDALKPRAYRAVTALCRGFVSAGEIAPDRLADDPALAREVLDNALTLLFRLLFLLYAESRELLPVRTNPAYRRKSLLALRERAARVRDEGEALFPRGRDFWSDLVDLFQIVDGDPTWRAVGVPVYNGGLFDPDKHPWLGEHYVADPELAEALDLLSRTDDPETERPHFVDYGPLDVRHLGSIYEGLLEHVLRVAAEELPAIRSKGRVVRDAVAAGELYLATDSGERHATGSYYTPDYIVSYIVERTLEPLVEGRSTAEILELKVLDPAMGSGHFLVAATAFLAREAVSAASESEQQALGDLAELDPEHLRRLVVERCIFGVDKNPRAVELAKLALWLATVQRDKPLNFLDHHLKCGDSLLGARAHELGALPERSGKTAKLEAAGQFNAFEGAFQQTLDRVVSVIRELETMPSEALVDVERKEAMHRQAEGLLERFREAADVWASTLFGNELATEDDGGEQDGETLKVRERRLPGAGDVYDRVLRRLGSAPDMWTEIESERWFTEAERLRAEHGFFHWDVEFGEVFYDEGGRARERPGFDAVVGNPPYVRMEEFKELKDFLRVVYETYATRSDLYVYFIERSLDLLREGGEYGVIVSNKFLRANYGKKLRALIGRETGVARKASGVREIMDFGGLPVFPEATVRAAIVRARRGRAVEEAPRYARIPNLEFESLGAAVQRHAFPLQADATGGEDWKLVPRRVAKVLEKLENAGQPLGESKQIIYGVKTGLNDAFILNEKTRERLIAEDPRSDEVIKPRIVGRDVARYYVAPGKEWLLYLPKGLKISRYPAVKRYLEQYREALEGRATTQEWFELQQPQQGYQEYFEEEKILYPDIGTRTRFAFDSGPLYPSTTCFALPGEDWFLLAVLNSRICLFYLTQTVALLEGQSEADQYLRFKRQYMERLPIPDAAPDTRDELAALARRMTELHAEHAEESSSFLAWLEERLGCIVDELSGKTYVRAYHEQPEGADKLLEVIERNRPSQTALDVRAPKEYGATNEARERIVRGYEKSMVTLAPIEREIEQTDARIDDLVYGLYGLTEEEIALVEEG